jgi:uncharacterized repeat protein (TIGR01451 family)
LLAKLGGNAPGATAVFVPDLFEGGVAERSQRLQALIAAEPGRVKEILDEHGTDWCGMAARSRERDPRRLMIFGNCPTEGPADLPANRDACIPTETTPFKTIRLKFNIFRNNDGSAAAATLDQVEAQMNVINASYAPARIRFVQTTEFINDSRYRSLSYFVNSEEEDMKRTYADRPGQQHNIYVVNIEPDPGGGSLLGVSTFPWDPNSAFASGGTILDDDSIGEAKQTLTHELGHALGLWHTHHGVREVSECSACWERADGLNGDTTGDLCSDTPPTPVNFKCQGPGGADPCSGGAWGETAPQNYMGYAPDNCYTEFTRQQAGRMHCWIQDRLQGWLADDQLVTVRVTASDPTAAEAGSDAGVFTISRTGTTATPLTVILNQGGSATRTADYHPIGDSVIIPAGSDSAAVRVTPVDDEEAEPNETVVLSLAEGAGYQIGSPATATVSIADDDSPPGLDILSESFDTVTAPVLPNGWTTTLAGVGDAWRTIEFEGLSLPNIVFALSVDDVGDSVLLSPIVSIPAGGARLAFTHGYALEEGYDGGVLEISIGGGPFTDVTAAGGVFEQGGYSGTISLEDESPIAGRPAWTGDSVVNVRSILRLPPSSDGAAVQLRWRLASDAGIAHAGWGIDDIEVTSLAGGGTVVAITAPDSTAAEAGADGGQFTVTRIGDLSGPLAVSLTVGGSAASGADYRPIPESIQIPAGSASAAVTITPIDDSEAEPAETVVLSIVGGAGYIVGTPRSATVMIRDNDGGTTGIVLAEAFDGVAIPNLPSGWSVAHSGDGVPWRTELYDGLTPPNVAFAPGPESTSDNALITPPISISTAEARLSFDHGYVLEDGYDGGVLEISIEGGPFTEILEAGGSILSGGYNGAISSSDGSIIAGRPAWTGDSVVNITTEVRLPEDAAGQVVQLRWRLVTDGGVGGGGWGIDNVTITEAIGGALPSVNIVASDGVAAEHGPDTGELTISRTGATTAPLPVSLRVGGTATAGVDYETIAATITIPAGSATAAVRIVPINDGADEGSEGIEVVLETSPAYVLGASPQAEVELLDNGTTGAVVFGANFDDASAPELPAGWTANLSGAGVPWATTTPSRFTPPNRVFAPDPDRVSDNLLISPPITIGTAAAQLVFVHEYQLEPGYDGGVLEIAIGMGPDPQWQDILAAGGAFVEGGYDAVLSRNDGSPIAGRSAWTGSSGGPVVTRVDLPSGAAGQRIQLRWRCAADAGVADGGWSVDTIAITEDTQGGMGADLGIALEASPSPVVAQSKLTYTITVTNQSAVVARGVVVTNPLPANVQLISATASQGTVSGTNTLVAQLGLLNGRASASVAVVVVPQQPGTVSNSALVGSGDVDPNRANNMASVATPVLPTSTPAFGYTNSAIVSVSDVAGPASLYPSTITVAGFQGRIGNIAVNLHGLSHTFPDDIDILLVGPGGHKVMLISDAGGDQRFGIQRADLTFEHAAPNALPDRAQIVTGSYRPADYEAGETLPGSAPPGPYDTSLAVFTGADPNGTWQLFMADDYDRDGGRLSAGWSLLITRAAANATPPSITTQPRGQTAPGGSAVTFSVAATGTAPLAYQWRFNGEDIPGATNAILTLNQVTPAQSGEYSVLVSNDAGVVLSQPVLLTVTTQTRQLFLGTVAGAPNASVTVPVGLRAQGDENRARFSVGFDTEQLRFSSVGLGAGATGAALSVNVNQLESGRFGVQMSLPEGRTFGAGEQELALLEFEVIDRNPGTAMLLFVDAPINREILSISAESLPADYLPGSVDYGGAGDRPFIGDLSAVGATVQFMVSGETGGAFQIESSPDLRTWTVLTIVANPTGTVSVTDPVPAGTTARFYRVLQVP